MPLAPGSFNTAAGGGSGNQGGTTGGTTNAIVKATAANTLGDTALFETVSGVLQVGGKTTSYAGVRSDGGGTLEVVLADNSNYAAIKPAAVTTAGGAVYAAGANGNVSADKGMYVPSGFQYFLTTAAFGAVDTGVSRAAAGVVTATDGSTGRGWLKNNEGDICLASDFTNATATLASTNLSVTLIAGRTYTFTGALFVSNSQSGEGVKLDFDGGSATATSFICQFFMGDTGGDLNTRVTAIATDATNATVTGNQVVYINGCITVNAAGTLILRAAENTHTSGTLTVSAGSWLTFRDARAV